jgi:hypothetical protein
MRWNAAAGLACLALAGCSEDGGNNAAAVEREAPETAQADSGQQSAAAPENEAAAAPDRQPGNGAGSLPPVNGQLRFVGRWASSAANCPNLAWRFTERRLETPAGSVCTFSEVTPAEGGYDIVATCTAEGPPTEDRITIRFAESAQAMLFESDSIADAGLVYCGSAA